MEIISDILSVDEQNEKLMKLKELAKESSLKGRIDEEYLNRFLIGHKYDINLALKAICNYESFVERRKDTWLNIDKTRLKLILDSQVIDVLDNNGNNDQKVVWIRLENWKTHRFTADEILVVSGLLCEAVYSEMTNIKHVDIIIDLNNFHFQHLYALSPRFAKRMVFFLSECLPMEMLNIYVVRQPMIFHLLFSLFKPFIVERMKKVIYVCGHNFQPLLDNIGRKILPQELDGINQFLYASRWYNAIFKPKTLKDLQLSGYKFYEEPLEKNIS